MDPNRPVPATAPDTGSHQTQNIYSTQLQYGIQGNTYSPPYPVQQTGTNNYNNTNNNNSNYGFQAEFQAPPPRYEEVVGECPMSNTPNPNSCPYPHQDVWVNSTVTVEPVDTQYYVMAAQRKKRIIGIVSFVIFFIFVIVIVVTTRYVVWNF